MLQTVEMNLSTRRRFFPFIFSLPLSVCLCSNLEPLSLLLRMLLLLLLLMLPCISSLTNVYSWPDFLALAYEMNKRYQKAKNLTDLHLVFVTLVT